MRRCSTSCARRCCSSCLPTRARVARGARLRDEVPAADRAGHRERRRGHRALSIQPPGSLNEVGGEPDTFGMSVRAFHADAQYRARSTGRTRCSAPRRTTPSARKTCARASTCCPRCHAMWRKTLRALEPHEPARKRESRWPAGAGPNDEYLLYQTLHRHLAARASSMRRAAAPTRERIEAYMVKAAREAKAARAGPNVNTDYEDALTQFVHTLARAARGQPVPAATSSACSGASRGSAC